MLQAYDCAVFLCRAQPFHRAHHKIVTRALSLGRQVVVLLGSHLRASNIRNPFSSVEREAMLRGCFDDEDNARIHVGYVRDYPYQNKRWLAEVKHTVGQFGFNSGHKIAIIGYKKDSTSDYLEWFKDWNFVDTTSFSKGVSATDIRASYFLEGVNWDEVADDKLTTREQFLSSATLKHALDRAGNYPWRDNVLPFAAAYLEEYRRKNEKRYLHWVYEYLHVLRKKMLKERYPYAIIEHTVDAVVTKGDYILLVVRGGHPGKGLYALPGGFLNEQETEFDACVRELGEEVIFQSPLADNRQEIIKCYTGNSQTFDDPMRSVRGRVITKAFHFDLPEDGDLPAVVGSDDASDAVWVSMADFAKIEDKLFEDHGDIIQHFFHGTSKRWRNY